MPTTEADILERIIEPATVNLTPTVARYLLTLNFPTADRQRLQELAAKKEALTTDEQAELERYRHVGQLLDRVHGRARQILEDPSTSSGVVKPFAVAPGIRRSQEAFWRDLPELLRNKKNHDKWICYHGDERIGIAKTQEELFREVRRRNLSRREFDLFIIEPRDLPPWEPEEIESLGPHHLEDYPVEA